MTDEFKDDLERLKYLSGVTAESGRLQEYATMDDNNFGYTNPGQDAHKLIQHQKENDIKPGSPEWFQLWFSKEHITGEKPW